VHHGGLFQGDFDVGGLDAVRRETEVLEVRLLNDVVAERVEVAVDGVDFRVGDHCGVELAVEVVTANGG